MTKEKNRWEARYSDTAFKRFACCGKGRITEYLRYDPYKKACIKFEGCTLCGIPSHKPITMGEV